MRAAFAARYHKEYTMKDKEKSTPNEPSASDDKISIDKSVFKVNKELRRKREEEQAKKEQEIAEKYAQQEKEGYRDKVHGPGEKPPVDGASRELDQGACKDEAASYDETFLDFPGFGVVCHK